MLYTCWYNFVKMHRTLGMTPALAAGLCSEMWEIPDLVAIVDRWDDA